MELWTQFKFQARNCVKNKLLPELRKLWYLKHRAHISHRRVVYSLDTNTTNIDCSKLPLQHDERYVQYCTCVAMLQAIA